MELIKAWLKGARDYKIGVRLYNQFGGDALLKKSLAEQESAFKKKLLEEALQKLYKAYTPPVHDDSPVPHTITSTYTPPSATEKKWSGESVQDETERHLWEAYRAHAKQQDYLRHNLEAMAADAERCEAAGNILRIDDEMDAIIAERDYYREHGKLQQKEPVDTVKDPIMIGKRVTTLERYVRRERTTLKNNPEKVEAARRLEKFLAELNIYYKQMGKDAI